MDDSESTEDNESQSEEASEDASEDDSDDSGPERIAPAPRVTVPGEAEQLFGRAAYDKYVENLQPGYIRRLAYRDSGSIYTLDWNGFITDGELVAQFLSKLSFQQLNQIDRESGDSLLHLAVKYNRGGLYAKSWNTGRQYIPYGELGISNPMPSTDNVVRWLLENTGFVQLHAPNANGDNAFHIAIGAKIPETVQFCSENHGGNLGRDFVAFAALATLLKDKNYAAAGLNARNSDGVTPLALAMNKSIRRGNMTIVFNDGRTNNIDCSIGDFRGDYNESIRMMLQCPQLRLDGMFDISPHLAGGWPDNASIADNKIVQTRLRKPECNRELQIFVEFCHSQISSQCLETILNSDCGNLCSEVKAVRMVVHTGNHEVGRFRNRNGWCFDPSHCLKGPGSVLRKFFLKHAKACMRAISNRRKELVEQANDLPRRSLRIQGLQSPENALQRREAIVDEWKRLKKDMDALNSDLPNFFVGGIYACLVRKYSLTNDMWVNVLQFAGWKTELPDISSLPGMPPPIARKRKRS